jgi:hypothetical protein
LVDEPFRKVAKKKAPFPPSPPVAPASLSSATRAPSNHKYRPQYQVEGASSDGSEGDDDDDDHFAAIRREYSSSSSLPKISQATRSKNQSGLMTRRGAPAENSWFAQHFGPETIRIIVPFPKEFVAFGNIVTSMLNSAFDPTVEQQCVVINICRAPDSAQPSMDYNDTQNGFCHSKKRQGFVVIRSPSGNGSTPIASMTCRFPCYILDGASLTEQGSYISLVVDWKKTMDTCEKLKESARILTFSYLGDGFLDIGNGSDDSPDTRLPAALQSNDIPYSNAIPTYTTQRTRHVVDNMYSDPLHFSSAMPWDAPMGHALKFTFLAQNLRQLLQTNGNGSSAEGKNNRPVVFFCPQALLGTPVENGEAVQSTKYPKDSNAMVTYLKIVFMNELNQRFSLGSIHPFKSRVRLLNDEERRALVHDAGLKQRMEDCYSPFPMETECLKSLLQTIKNPNQWLTLVFAARDDAQVHDPSHMGVEIESMMNPKVAQTKNPTLGGGNSVLADGNDAVPNDGVHGEDASEAEWHPLVWQIRTCLLRLAHAEDEVTNSMFRMLETQVAQYDEQRDARTPVANCNSNGILMEIQSDYFD